MLRKKGQSTLEYVIILTAIVAGILFAAVTFLKPKVESSMSHIANEMEAGVNRLNLSE